MANLVQIKLAEGRVKIKLKSSPNGQGDGALLDNGTVMEILNDSVTNNAILVKTLDGSNNTGYIDIKHLHKVQSMNGDVPLMTINYTDWLRSRSTPSLAPPQYAPPPGPPPQQYAPPPGPPPSQYAPPPQQYAPPPGSPPQYAPPPGSSPSYGTVMQNITKYPRAYQDPHTMRYYSVNPDGNTTWLNGGLRRRKFRSHKKRHVKSRSRSNKSRSKKSCSRRR
jgi:hypothetical protein